MANDRSFSHIYMCFNKEVDALSKDAIGDLFGSIQFLEFLDGLLIDSSVYQVF